ncbi:alpha-N-acetylgalactosaminide alpha-2,6-sialyltransferase 1-like [Hyperolius riggenbachi]|uniref:alpha-N-acetylgalactosaminide alpha-2,6-sialyltransferase 1-like n=1 Tax=Hyperolius riggenbachi TaxID=752182 RepID=UPI0035A27699
MKSSCPISIKIKAMNSSWLKQKFLPQITIFMDNRHFNDREWLRLGHFIPPFGWMDLNYTEVKEVMLALPLVPDQQLLLAEKAEDDLSCISCAVVGNGGILNGSGLGKEIDSHNYVFRINAAITEGYEKDVGNRTSFYGFTAFSMLTSLYSYFKKGFRHIPQDKETRYILLTENIRDFQWLKAVQQNKEFSKENGLSNYRLRPRDEFEKDFDFRKLFVVHPDFARYLKNRFLRSTTLDGKYWDIYRPSAGALFLLTALHLCDVVSAYGFMTDDYKKYSDHYYDKDKMETVLFKNHDFLMEKDLWARMHQENIIKLYQRT